MVRDTVGAGRPLYELARDRLGELAPDLIVTQAVCEVCAVSYDDVVAVAAALPSRPRVLSLDPLRLGDVLDDLVRVAEAAGDRGAGLPLATTPAGGSRPSRPRSPAQSDRACSRSSG